MKGLRNFIVLIMIILIGNFLFPEYVEIDSYKTAIIVSVVLLIIQSILIALYVFAVAVLIPKMKDWQFIVTIILTIVFFIIIIPVCIWLCTVLIPGFKLHGILTYVLMTGTIYVTMGDNDNKKN